MSQIDVSTVDGVMFIHVEGPLLAEEAAQIVRDHYPGQRGHKTVWDLLLADLSQISREQLKGIARVLFEVLGAESARRTAFVVRPGLTFGITRMYQMTAENQGVEARYRVVNSVDEALAWLSQGGHAPA